ncbi:MAG: hypothetical protein H6835_16630 [Planctomycetes bacterium]|nr:hypothetical protein [Planctomycetota bacterium]
MATSTRLAPFFLAAAIASAPAPAQAVGATVTAATQLKVTAVSNTDTRPAGFDLTGGLTLSASYFQTAFLVQVDANFALTNNTASGGAIVYTVNEGVSGFGLSPTTAGPHATRLQLTSPQTRTGTLRVTFSGSGTASVDIGDDGSVEWTQAAGSPWQQQVAVVGNLPIRVATSLSSSSHALTVQFTPDPPLAQLPLSNPGFESGFIDWETFGNAFAEAASPPAIVPRSGNSVCKMYGMFSGAFNVSGAYQTFAASPGETYALDCHARHWSGDAMTGPGMPYANQAEKKIEFFDAAGALLAATAQTVLDGTMPTDTWVHTPTVVATAPPGTVTVRAVLLFLQPGMDSGAAQFDDVAFGLSDGCGAFSLSTGDNGGVGYATTACFTLDVTAVHGVHVCGIDVINAIYFTSPFQATLNRHRTLTDYTQLTPATNGPDDWCEVGTLSSPVAGYGAPIQFAITNATGSLDLPPGQHLLSIRPVPNQALVMRCSPGTTRSLTDGGANLTFSGGVTTDQLGVFGTSCIDCTLHYDVANAPLTEPACVASVAVVGTSCGSAPNMVYEQFSGANPWDLTPTDVLLTATGDGASLSTVPHTALVPAIAPNLGLYQSTASALIPLGFDLAAFGLPAVTSISVCSNGSIFLGGIGDLTGVEAATTLGNEVVPRVMALWNLFETGNGETIHVDVNPGVEAVVTFRNMNEYVQLLPQTFQVVLQPTTIRIRYEPNQSYFTNDGMVGFYNGVPFTPPNTSSRVDLTAGPTVATSTAARPELALASVTRPLLGASFDVILDHNPLIGVVFAEIGFTSAGLPLPTPLFAPDCRYHLGVDPLNIGVTVSPSATFSIVIPNDTLFLDLPLALQGVAIDSNWFMSSNALQANASNF